MVRTDSSIRQRQISIVSIWAGANKYKLRWVQQSYCTGATHLTTMYTLIRKPERTSSYELKIFLWVTGWLITISKFNARVQRNKWKNTPLLGTTDEYTHRFHAIVWVPQTKNKQGS